MELAGSTATGDTLSRLAAAVSRFEDDLSQAGVEARAMATLGSLYSDALLEASDRAWSRLYRATFSTLRALARRPTTRIQSRAALETLLRLLEDDLGLVLFGAPAIGRLRASLVLDANSTYRTTRETVPAFIGTAL